MTKQRDKNNLLKNVFNMIRKSLTDQEFINKHKTDSTCFVRQRMLDFPTVFTIVLSSLCKSLQSELDEFYKSLYNNKVAKKEVTKSAFSQARKKIKSTAFIELIEAVSNFFYKNMNYIKWHKFRLFSIDGSKCQLQKTPETKSYSKEIQCHENSASYIMANVSVLYDILNQIIYDADFSPISIGEKKMAIMHCNKLKKGDLVLLDRGYPAFYLFTAIKSKGAEFCFRMPINSWKIVKEFLASGDNDRIIDLDACTRSAKKNLEFNLPIDFIKVRLVLIELDTGEKEVLLTSLINKDEYEHKIFKDLYHLRWGIEENYKRLKSVSQLENLSGKSMLSIAQDFFAKILAQNLISFTAFQIQDKLIMLTKNRKLKYFINYALAIFKIKSCIVFLIFSKRLKYYISIFEELLLENLSPIRKGREYKVKIGIKKLYSYNTRKTI